MENIKSLQEFITQIDNYDGRNWYFRGESKDYGESRNLASGYRWMVDRNKVFMDLLNLRKEFFREVGVNLSFKEVENFLAYAQHQGLPTELLDITSNPLVALYFACESNFDEDGYLYLFDNSVYDARTDKSATRQFQYSPYRDLTQKLFSEDISQQKIWFRWSAHIDDDVIQKDMMEQENQYVYELFHGSEMFQIQHQNEVAWKEYSEANPKLAKLQPDVSDFIAKFYDKDGTIDDRLNRQLESIIGLAFELIRITEGKYFPNLRYLLVKPTIIFNRMKNQQGAFIYQLTTSHGDDKGYFQPIIPSVTIKISAESKRYILKQLDLIGINKKFLYSDDGSVAEYLKNNYNDSFYTRLHPLG